MEGKMTKLYLERALEIAKQTQKQMSEQGFVSNKEFPIRSGIDYLVGYLEAGVEFFNCEPKIK